MAFSLFAPPATNWYRERIRREGETRSPYERAITATRGDVTSAARANAAPGMGNAAARSASQALAPELARLRAQQANALDATRAGVRRDIRSEMEAQNSWANDFLGGLAGIAGQTMVPLISGLGNGGNPGQNGGPSGGRTPFAGGGMGGLLGAAAPIAGMVNPAVGLGMGAASGVLGGARSGAPGMGPIDDRVLHADGRIGLATTPIPPSPTPDAMAPAGLMSPEDEAERRRREAAARLGGRSPFATLNAGSMRGMFR